MNLRPLLLSVAVLVPLAAAVWWFQRPQPAASAADPRVGQRLADPAALADAARVRINSGEKSIELTRAEGGRWVVAGEPALPADATRLTRLSSDLVAAKVERFVTANKERLGTLDFGSAGVAFLDADGKPVLELDLGKTADGGGRFVRFGAGERAYLARLNVYLDAEPSSWRDTALVSDLKPEDVASVSIGFPDTPASVVVSRTAPDSAWTSPAVPAGHQVKSSSVSGQLTTLTGLRYTGVTPVDDPAVVAARPHARELALTAFDGRSVKLVFARAPEPPAPPAPAAAEEGATPPAPPPAAPRPVYVEVHDSRPDSALAAAAKTHAFSVGDWIYTGLPASASDLFEPVPAPAPAVTTPAE